MPDYEHYEQDDEVAMLLDTFCRANMMSLIPAEFRENITNLKFNGSVLLMEVSSESLEGDELHGFMILASTDVLTHPARGRRMLVFGARQAMMGFFHEDD